MRLCEPVIFVVVLVEVSQSERVVGQRREQVVAHEQRFLRVDGRRGRGDLQPKSREFWYACTCTTALMLEERLTLMELAFHSLEPAWKLPLCWLLLGVVRGRSALTFGVPLLLDPSLPLL